MKEMTRKEFLKLTGASTALLAMSHIIPTSAYADTSKIDAPSAGMYISEVVDLSGLSPVEQEKILTERNIPYDSTITYEKIVVERPAARDSYKGVPYRFQITYGNIPTSIQSSKDIYVSLFGELSISTSKGVLKEADFNSPRISRLISYLLISRKNAISPQEITQTLWPDDSDNPAKNVKGLVYRLRQKFSIISDEPLVLSSASGYQLNPELHIMTDYQRFDELVSSAVRASSVINKVDILKNALDLYHGKVLSSADGEHWLIQFATKYHLSYMGAVSELLKQLDSLHSYDLLNQYAMKSLTIAPDNPKAYCWLVRSLKAQGMNELATNELAAAKEHLTTEEYEEILAFGANW